MMSPDAIPLDLSAGPDAVRWPVGRVVYPDIAGEAFGTRVRA